MIPGIFPSCKFERNWLLVPAAPPAGKKGESGSSLSVPGAAAKPSHFSELNETFRHLVKEKPENICGHNYIPIALMEEKKKMLPSGLHAC